MRAHEFSEQRSFASRNAALLTWLGGGRSRELGERLRAFHARRLRSRCGVRCGARLADRDPGGPVVGPRRPRFRRSSH